MSTFLLTVVSVSIIISLRSQLVKRHMMRRLDDIRDVSHALIEARKPWEHLFSEMDTSFSNFLWLCLDLTKWRYRDFFPKDVGE